MDDLSDELLEDFMEILNPLDISEYQILNQLHVAAVVYGQKMYQQGVDDATPRDVSDGPWYYG